MQKIIFFIAIIFSSFQLSAQKVSFVAEAKKVVAVGERFRLEFSVNKSASGFRAPDLNAFNYSGPSTSTNISANYINGRVSRATKYAYSYVLQPKKEGKFTIGSAEINVDGKTYKSNPITIQVIKRGSNSNATTNNNNSQTKKISSKDLFAAVILSKKEAYRGEHVIATVKIFSRVNLAGFNDIKFPTFNGFWSQEIDIPSQINMQREVLNGTVYETGVLKQLVLFPQQTGEITIEPFELDLAIRQRSKRRSFFDSGYKNISKKIKSYPVKLKVKALPNNAPEDFKGLVGKNLKIFTSITKEKVKQNDAITLKIKISGNGNLKLADAPSVKFPADFEIYDPKIINNISNTINGTSGSKTFEYLVIPRHHGDFKIPKTTLTHFDIQSKTYKTLSSKEFKIEVEKGENSEISNNTVVSSTVNKEKLKTLGNDIRFIKTNEISFSKKKEYFTGTQTMYVFYIASLLIFLSIFFVHRKKMQENANIALMKNKRASKVSKKRLKTAEIYLKENKKEEFYSEILRATWGYLSDKMGIPVSELNQNSINERLTEKKVDDNVKNQLSSIISECEFARYSPSDETGKMDNIYNQTSEVINRLESKLR